VKKIFVIAFLLACAAVPASAQYYMDQGPRPRRSKDAPQSAPLALALDLAFGATFWNAVQVSTMGPVNDVSQLVREGYYKLEIIQLVMISQQGHQPLKKTVEKRKKGAELSKIAAESNIDYDELYESALAVEDVVDKQYLPRFPEKPPRKERDEW
jgi:hypothetical protein